jgi:hypothetical protein
MTRSIVPSLLQNAVGQILRPEALSLLCCKMSFDKYYDQKPCPFSTAKCLEAQ